jgi:hypothetical protein
MARFAFGGVMRNFLYSLEDYFEALAEEHAGRFMRRPAQLMSFTCAILGDAIGACVDRASLFPSHR